jgi:hypothetical protein
MRWGERSESESDELRESRDLSELGGVRKIEVAGCEEVRE